MRSTETAPPSQRRVPLLLPSLASLIVAASGLVFQVWLEDTTPVVVYILRVVLAGCSTRLFTVAFERRDPFLDWLVEGINIIHSVDVKDDTEYIVDEGYKTLIHGDYCLPNILVKNDKINGFVDLGGAGIGDPWRDYAWCIWSLEYNLGTKEYTPLFVINFVSLEQQLCIPT